MSKSLTIVEAIGLIKLAEKELKKLEEEGANLPSGNHTFNFTVTVDGGLSRGEDTKAAPPFSLSKFLKPMLLRYISKLSKKEQGEWMQNLMSDKGALGAVIELGADKVLRSVSPELIALWDAAEADAKKKFQKVTPKVDKNGPTHSTGGLTKHTVASVTANKKRL
jgi:hypothetical protein